MICDWVDYDEDCKYRFDSHCTLPPLNIENRPDDAKCKKEVEYEYRRYVHKRIKELKRDSGFFN